MVFVRVVGFGWGRFGGFWGIVVVGVGVGVVVVGNL